jgi:hypothetical protein
MSILVVNTAMMTTYQCRNSKKVMRIAHGRLVAPHMSGKSLAITTRGNQWRVEDIAGGCRDGKESAENSVG